LCHKENIDFLAELMH